MNDEPDEFYELEMPFVVVRSTGGVFDDDSYCAGYEMGCIDAHLATLAPICDTADATIRTDNIKQADLIAMRHNLAVEFSEGENGWTHAHFTRSESRDSA
jgi:hypothetical protein